MTAQGTRPSNRLRVQIPIVLVAALILGHCSQPPSGRRWLAGDTHIHSHWSASYDGAGSPPPPSRGGEALYSTPMNARMARQYGLEWMVTTDHGGPHHAKFNLTQAYPELEWSRQAVPDVVQFYGMELNMPGMDHHTLIIPHAADEASVLFDIESRFDKREAWPLDPAADTAEVRRAALDYMRQLPQPPLLLANHPSRSATGIGEYGQDEPWELRESNDRAPDVYRGMEGAPGHQAAPLTPEWGPRRDESVRPTGHRGYYRNPGAHTLGGFDQMTAIVGGLWDAMLGEGRRFWIVATSDSHVHYAETARRGIDFWPGEFHKTYVYAEKTHADLLDGLRRGRIFVTAGDLVTELDVVASAGGQSASIGGLLEIAAGDGVDVTIRFRDPDTVNPSGENPSVARVNLIMGQVRGPVSDPDADRNETAHVVARFTDRDWRQEGDRSVIVTTLPEVDGDVYVRVRGTSNGDAEPRPDEIGENPWHDLWFYSNPIFIDRR